jgi:hypothetical protein
MNRLVPITALLAACGGSAPEPKASAPEQLRAPADELSFILGQWRMLDGPATVEERWVRAPDGTLLGSGRVTVQGMLGFSETLSVVRQGDSLVYTAWPAGQDPVPFHRISNVPNDVTFENPSHDFPQRIRYQRKDDSTLIATAEGQGPEGPKIETMTLTRVLPGAAAADPKAANAPAPAAPKEDNAAPAPR